MKKATVLFICAALAIGIGIGAAASQLKNFSFPQITFAEAKKPDPHEAEIGKKPTAENYDQLHNYMTQNGKKGSTNIQVRPNWDATEYAIQELVLLDHPTGPVWSVPLTLEYNDQSGKHRGPLELEAYWKDGEIVSVCETIAMTKARKRQALLNLSKGIMNGWSVEAGMGRRLCLEPKKN